MLCRVLRIMRRVAAETFGERLRRIRDDRGLSVGALAQRVGVTEGAVRQMESGQTKSASFVVGVRLAHELGVSSEYLALGSEIATPPGAGDGTAEPSLEERRAILNEWMATAETQMQETRDRLDALEKALRVKTASGRSGRKTA